LLSVLTGLYSALGWPVIFVFRNNHGLDILVSVYLFFMLTEIIMRLQCQK